MFIGPSQSNDYASPSVWGLTLLKIDLVSAQHLQERSQVLETCSQESRHYKYLLNAEVSICISIPGKGRGNLGLMSVTLLSQRFPLVKELKNILIGPFEFAYCLHAIHSVK